MGKKEVFQPASVGKDSFFFLYCYKLDGFFILLRWIQFVNEYLSLKFITIC